jgi:hypothetical protein
VAVALCIAPINVTTFYLERRWLSKSPWSECDLEPEGPGEKR